MLDLISSFPLPKSVRENLENANSIKAILNGKPTRKALNLTYLHNSKRNRTYNPDQDNCGLIWYAPLVEMSDYAVDNYVKHVHTICEKHDIDPLITLTSLNGRCFDSTVPILFNKHSADHSRRADACFDELLESGREKGFFPYRLPIDAMQKLCNYNPDFFNQVLSIKEALDPDKVIAPGRYCPVSRREVTGNIVEGRFNKAQ